MTLENLSVLRAFAVKMTFCSEVTDAARTNFALGHPTFVLLCVVCGELRHTL